MESADQVLIRQSDSRVCQHLGASRSAAASKSSTLVHPHGLEGASTDAILVHAMAAGP